MSEQSQIDVPLLLREFGQCATHATCFAKSIIRISSSLDLLVHKAPGSQHDAQNRGVVKGRDSITMGETLRLLQSSARNMAEIFAPDLAKRLNEGCTKPINDLGKHRGVISALVAANTEDGEDGGSTPRKADKYQVEACKVAQTFVQSVQEFIYAIAGSIDNTNANRQGGFWERMQSAVPVATSPSSERERNHHARSPQQSPDKGAHYRTMRVESPPPRDGSGNAVLIRVHERKQNNHTSEQHNADAVSGGGPTTEAPALDVRPTLVNALRQRPKADRRGIRLEQSTGSPQWADYGPSDNQSASSSPTNNHQHQNQEQLRSPKSDAVTQTLSVKEDKKRPTNVGVQVEPKTRGAGAQTEDALVSVRSAQTDEVSAQPQKQTNLVTPAPSVIGMQGQPSGVLRGSAVEVEIQTGASLSGVPVVPHSSSSGSTNSGPKNSRTPSVSDAATRPRDPTADTRPNPNRGINRQDSDKMTFETPVQSKGSAGDAKLLLDQPRVDKLVSFDQEARGRRTPPPPPPPPIGFPFAKHTTTPTPYFVFQNEKTPPVSPTTPASPAPGNDELLAAIRAARDKKPSDFARSRSPSPQPKPLPAKVLTPQEALMAQIQGKFGRVRRNEDDE